MKKLPQVRRLAFNDEEIGMGFNSQTGLAVGTPLEGFTVSVNNDAPGDESTSSISIASSHEELQTSLGMSFDAQGRYGLLAASVKAKFSWQTNYNSTSTFVVASVVVQKAFKRGKGFKVMESVKPLLQPNRIEEFKTAFGDSFVRGLQTGGEFYAVVRITSVSTQTQTDLGATLSAECNGLVAAGSFKAAFATANASGRTASEFEATMYQRAGAGATISAVASIDEVINRFKKFSEIVAGAPRAYETEVATYDTLPLPVPTPEEGQAFRAALEDAREKMLRYIQTRNDLELAFRKPQFYESPPEANRLQDAANRYTKLLNAVTDHAVRLSNGQIKPPKFFDGSVLNPPLTEPEPIRLQKKDISIPDKSELYGQWLSATAGSGLQKFGVSDGSSGFQLYIERSDAQPVSIGTSPPAGSSPGGNLKWDAEAGILTGETVAPIPFGGGRVLRRYYTIRMTNERPRQMQVDIRVVIRKSGVVLSESYERATMEKA